MREAEGKRRASRSEAIAIISLIVFIICFQFVTFLVGRFAPLDEEGGDDYVSLPDNDSIFITTSEAKTTGNADSCLRGGNSVGRQRKSERGKDGLSGSGIIKIRRNNTPYGHRQYGYKRAEKINLNTADSAVLTTLYGSGPYFAKRIIEYRERLGGSFVSEFQLLEIHGIDSARFGSIRGRIAIDGNVRRLSIADSSFNFLRRNPYIGYGAAKKIIAFREENGADMCSLENLLNAGILNHEQFELLKAYVIE